MMQPLKVELTDSEWVSILDPEADGLPRCCANISALRDQFYNIMRSGKILESWYYRDFIIAYIHVVDSHEFDNKIIVNVVDLFMKDESFSDMFDFISKIEHSKQVNENVDLKI